jgi:hypothetical protein
MLDPECPRCFLNLLAVLCLVFLLFTVGRKKAKERKKIGKMAFCWANWSQPVLGSSAVMCKTSYFKGWLLDFLCTLHVS